MERKEKIAFGNSKLGFGCMRLPMSSGTVGMDGVVDSEQFQQMVDLFLAAGGCYFDTAHGYISGKSEPAIKQCLVERYPREAYLLTNKLTKDFFTCKADIKPFFEQQLELTGVTYFDYYLMHSLTADLYQEFCDCQAFSVAKELRAAGKIRHLGISFHDQPKLLEQILSEHPEVEVVQIQFNYADYDDTSIQSRAVYEVCRSFNKPIIVMEPVKGGSLAELPPKAARILDALHGASHASYAIRYAASFPGGGMVLSGMSSLEQMQDNLSFMRSFTPLNEQEYAAVEQVREILKQQDTIPCTACHYCTGGCPQRIMIPELFSCLNAKKAYDNWNSDFYYGVNTGNGHGKASACIKCGKCERSCPQHLPVTKLLEEVAAVFEQEDDPGQAEANS